MTGAGRAALWGLIALLILLIPMLWPSGPWVDLLAPSLFLLGFSRRSWWPLYLALFASVVVDILFGLHPGTTAPYYLTLTYLAVRGGLNLSITKTLSIFAFSLASFVLAYGFWLGLQNLVGSGGSFPFGLPVFPVASLFVILLWRR